MSTFKNLSDVFIKNAFREAMRCGIIQDGHYHRQTDLDVALMYCAGGEL